MVRTSTLRPLTPAFVRQLWWTRVFLVVFALLAFAATTGHVLRRQTRSFLVEQAKLCGVAVVPGQDGDLTESVARLRARYGTLVAIATLDASGKLHAVYPERPSYRLAASAVVESGTNGPIAIKVPQDGEQLAVSGVIVPLSGDPTPHSQKAVILLRRGSHSTAGLVQAVVAFALLIGAAALFTAYAMRRWFDCGIAGPLRQMVSAARDPLRNPDRMAELPLGDSCETAELAKQLTDLVRSAAQSEANATRLESETEHRLMQHKVGFDRQLRRVKDQASLDSLTGLRNRTFLEDELEPLFARHVARRQDFSAVMVDVDNFKQYNDAQGHPAGDTLLQFVGELLRGATRSQDHTIRYGGDEFLLLLPETTSEQAGAIAERLVKLFGQYATRLDGKHELSLSAGVASLARDAPKTGHALVATADAALYRAKRGGKNVVAGHRAA